MFDSPGLMKEIYAMPGISKDQAALVASKFSTEHLTKNDKWDIEGTVCRRVGYVNKGCMSYYRIAPDGKKTILHFPIEDWWAGDLRSFLQRIPTETNYEALEDTELIIIYRDDFEYLLKTVQPFYRWFYEKTQIAFLKELENASKNKSENAIQRYERMLCDYPHIIQRVPHYDVAAYLGITPESLSRIRKKISVKN